MTDPTGSLSYPSWQGRLKSHLFHQVFPLSSSWLGLVCAKPTNQSVMGYGAPRWLATICQGLLWFVCMASSPTLKTPPVTSCERYEMCHPAPALTNCTVVGGTQTYHGCLSHFFMSHCALHSLHAWWKYMMTNQGVPLSLCYLLHLLWLPYKQAASRSFLC